MSAGTVGLEGMEQVLNNMAKIDRQFDRKVVIPSVRAALKPIRTKARQLQKHQSLKKTIKSRAFKSKKGDILGKVFLSKNKDGRTINLEGREVGFEVVGNILEFGSAKRNITPQPFMRPAREQAAGQARTAMEKEAKKRLARI